MNGFPDLPSGRAAVLARQFRMPEEVVDGWLDAAPNQGWAVSNMRVLHEVGLSAQDGADLYRRLDESARPHAARLVDAGRMASLDPAWLHWWAASGLLKPETGLRQNRRGRSRPMPVSFNKWVTSARRYIAATGGDQKLAALAAAAHLSVEETAEQVAEGGLDEAALATLVALRESLGGP